MKSLHVLQNTLPYLAGYTIRGNALMQALKGHGVQIAALSGPVEKLGVFPTEEINGILHYRTVPRTAGSLPGLREWKLQSALRTRLAEVAGIEKPDLIHVHSPAYNGIAGLAVARQRGIPCVYEMRAVWEDAAVDRQKFTTGSLIYKGSRALETYVLRQSAAVVTICEGLRREVVGRGIPAGKVFVAPNGVEPVSFEPVPKDAAFAREIGLDGFPVFGFIGSLFNYEGVEDLLDAAPILLDRFPNARILVLGGGEREPQVRKKIEEMARPEVVYRQRVPHDQVKRFYSVVDCLVYPRRRMRLTDLVTPLKPLEAMAMNKAVIASNVGGHREMIEHNVTGLLYEPESATGLADALCRIAAEPGLAGRLAEQGRTYVLRERNWAKTTEGHLAAYAYALRKETLTKVKGSG